MCGKLSQLFVSGVYQSANGAEAHNSKYRITRHHLSNAFFQIKGALDNFSLIPWFFSKSWDFYTIRSVYICSNSWLILFATST